MLFKLLALALPLLSNALVLPRCGSGCGIVSAMLADITFVQNVVNFEICIISIDARRAAAVLGHSYGPLLTCSEPLNPNYIIQLNTIINTRTTTNQFNVQVQTINQINVNVQTTFTQSAATITEPASTTTTTSTTTTSTSATSTVLTTTTTSDTATVTSTTTTSTSTTSTASVPIQTIGLLSGVIQLVQTTKATNTNPGAILYVGKRSVPQPSDANPAQNPPSSKSGQPVGGGNQMVVNQVDALKVFLSAPMGTCASISANFLNIYAPMVENVNTQFQYFGLGSNSATDGENNLQAQFGDLGLFGPVAQTPFGPPTQGAFASYGNKFYAESQIWTIDCTTHILQANYQSVNPGVHNGPTGPQQIIVNPFTGAQANTDGVVYTDAYTKFVIQGSQQSDFIFVPDEPGFF